MREGQTPVRRLAGKYRLTALMFPIPSLILLEEAGFKPANGLALYPMPFPNPYPSFSVYQWQAGI